MTILKGITWDYSRGFTSAVATAQRFHQLFPEVDIVWEKRSLQAFADEYVTERSDALGTLEMLKRIPVLYKSCLLSIKPHKSLRINVNYRRFSIYSIYLWLF